jgi:hypothetical protein
MNAQKVDFPRSIIQNKVAYYSCEDGIDYFFNTEGKAFKASLISMYEMVEGRITKVNGITIYLYHYMGDSLVCIDESYINDLLSDSIRKKTEYFYGKDRRILLIRKWARDTIVSELRHFYSEQLDSTRYCEFVNGLRIKDERTYYTYRYDYLGRVLEKLRVVNGDTTKHFYKYENESNCNLISFEFVKFDDGIFNYYNYDRAIYYYYNRDGEVIKTIEYRLPMGVRKTVDKNIYRGGLLKRQVSRSYRLQKGEKWKWDGSAKSWNFYRFY